MSRGQALQALITRPLGESYRSSTSLDDLSADFVRDGHVKLPGLLAQEVIGLLRAEVATLEPAAQARDFVMPGPSTPRVMNVLGAKQLLAHSTALAVLYAHFELVGLISTIAGEAIYACPHPEEVMVCNFLLTDGATHGWHLDDPAYALVFVLAAPAESAGGDLEYIADWSRVCRDSGADPSGDVALTVDRARRLGLVKRRRHRVGDAYLLRADRCLHRVTPLSGSNERRVALNFAYERTTTATYGESATVLYEGSR